MNIFKKKKLHHSCKKYRENLLRINNIKTSNIQLSEECVERFSFLIKNLSERLK